MNEVLNKALALSYIHSKIAVKNLEFANHELKLEKEKLMIQIKTLKSAKDIKDESIKLAIQRSEKAGQMQHRTEKLIGAFNKLFAVMEKHGTEEVESEINLIMDQCWE
jgi:hypothetical protein